MDKELSINGKQDRQAWLKTASILFGIGSAIVLIVLVELAAYLFLLWSGRNVHPFLLNIKQDEGIKAISPMFEGDMYSYLDPHLGYAHNPNAARVDYKSLPGFTIYGSGAGDGKVLRIVTLGGSTTDGNTPHIWAQALQEIIAKDGIKVQVINGGVAGFSSNQELIKMIRDVLPLKPDVIISLNGVNEYGVRAAVRFHPMVNMYQASVMDYLVKEPEPLFMPNALYVVRRFGQKLSGTKPIQRGVNYGPKVDISASEQWLRNVRLMHAAAAEFGIPYLCFLQPALGIGEYQPTEQEKKFLMNEEGEIIYGYLDVAKEFYEAARSSCAQHSYCVDLVDVFVGEQDVYVDKMHPNVKGYEIIAQAVYQVLKEKEPMLFKK